MGSKFNPSHPSRPTHFSRTDVISTLKAEGADDEMIAIVLPLLKLENYSQEIGGELWYRIDYEYTSGNDSYAGLGQFNRPTWASVSDASFNDAVLLAPSIRAVMGLVKANNKSFTVYKNRYGWNLNFDSELAYLFHNQGAWSAAKILNNDISSKHRLQIDNQSEDAQVLIRKFTGKGVHIG